MEQLVRANSFFFWVFLIKKNYQHNTTVLLLPLTTTKSNYFDFAVTLHSSTVHLSLFSRRRRNEVRIVNVARQDCLQSIGDSVKCLGKLVSGSGRNERKWETNNSFCSIDACQQCVCGCADNAGCDIVQIRQNGIGDGLKRSDKYWSYYRYVANDGIRGVEKHLEGHDDALAIGRALGRRVCYSDHVQDVILDLVCAVVRRAEDVEYRSNRRKDTANGRGDTSLSISKQQPELG